MRLTILAALIVLTACSGFGTSKLNPLNWFKKSQPEVYEFAVRPADPRPLVAEVTALDVMPTPGGAIITARGLPPSQGHWDAELVRIPGEDPSIALYEFRLFPPPEPRPAGSPASREVTVATSISEIALQEVAKIVVQGAANALSSRR